MPNWVTGTYIYLYMHKFSDTIQKPKRQIIDCKNRKFWDGQLNLWNVLLLEDKTCVPTSISSSVCAMRIFLSSHRAVTSIKPCNASSSCNIQPDPPSPPTYPWDPQLWMVSLHSIRGSFVIGRALSSRCGSAKVILHEWASLGCPSFTDRGKGACGWHLRRTEIFQLTAWQGLLYEIEGMSAPFRYHTDY